MLEDFSDAPVDVGTDGGGAVEGATEEAAEGAAEGADGGGGLAGSGIFWGSAAAVLFMPS